MIGRTAAAPSKDTAARLLQARRRVASAFSSQGELAGTVSGFTPRDSQREMALAVFDAIIERATLVAEAGTGTGKTFAYLVPALLAGGKVLVSTGTKTLQDQVHGKDLAQLTAALGLKIETALLKGRPNYLCLLRLERAQAEGRLPSRQDVEHLRTIGAFARLTESGDRAELTGVPESATIWPLVTSTRENCIGHECPHVDRCFVYKARRAAQAADIVVVNHHLFLADLVLREDAIGDFLPSVDTVVLDEAHQLPRIAADFFGTGWSLAQLADLAQDTRAVGLAKAPGGGWVALSQGIETAARNLRLMLAEAGVGIGVRVALNRCRSKPSVRRAMLGIEEALTRLAAGVKAHAGRDVELDALGPRVAALRTELGQWIKAFGEEETPVSTPDSATEASADGEAKVRWLAATPHGAQFHSTPLAPGAAFARAREQQPQAWILTSATLTLAGSFKPFLADIGLPDARTARWESPFDFPRQALLYLPQPLPSPLQNDFPERVADAAWPVIAAARGRAFVLCSTLRAVERVAARLASAMARDGVDLPLLVQGARPRRALLQEFRSHGNAVLVGSVSFWEGIDVRGEALSLVVIDKLPFAPPDDPLVEARIRRLRSLGRNPFLEYQLPEAVTLLKQGVGRLIRDEADRGVLMILDERVLGKPYGKTVLASLPPFSRTRDERTACQFFSASVSGA